MSFLLSSLKKGNNPREALKFFNSLAEEGRKELCKKLGLNTQQRDVSRLIKSGADWISCSYRPDKVSDLSVSQQTGKDAFNKLFQI